MLHCLIQKQSIALICHGLYGRIDTNCIEDFFFELVYMRIDAYEGNTSRAFGIVTVHSALGRELGRTYAARDFFIRNVVCFHDIRSPTKLRGAAIKPPSDRHPLHS